MAKLKLIRAFDEVGNIRTFAFDTGGATWLPGQYQGYVLAQAGDTEDENTRWFTIASAPVENEIHISTRVSDSKFKQALNALHPGDSIECKDLDGDFTWENDDEVVLVAGGIGATPYRSYFEQRDKSGQKIPATLLYYGRNDQFAFREMFDGIAAKHPELKIQYIVGEMISADGILKTAPQSKSQVVYISGPEGMVENVGNDLKAHGVNVKQDWFPGYDETNY